jgi:hypothetical protein
MPQGNQIRADFGVINQLAADQNTLAGNVENIRSTLRTLASQALSNIDGGMGAAEHQACMAQVDRLIDEYINGTRDLNSSTTNVGDRFLAGGNQAARVLGSGA